MYRGRYQGSFNRGTQVRIRDREIEGPRRQCSNYCRFWSYLEARALFLITFLGDIEVTFLILKVAIWGLVDN